MILLRSTVKVPCTLLDDFLYQAALPPPAFVKIDAEGAELSVLRGMKRTLTHDRLAMMVEVTENAAEVWSLLTAAGFHLFHPDKSPVSGVQDVRGNVFCVKSDDERIAVFSSKEYQAGGRDPNAGL